MRHALLISLFALAASALACADSHAADDRKATSKADAWLGHDAADLLTQLRVDGGRVQINENEETGETSYTWSTINPAYTEDVVIGSSQTMIGLSPAGPGVAATPIFRTDYQTAPVHHDATHRCSVTFYANLDGIIDRWEYDGPQCRADIAKPKN